MTSQECVAYPEPVREMLVGKTVLVIGSSYGGQRNIWNTLSQAKIKVILIGNGASNHDPGHLDTFIEYDYTSDQFDIESHASNILGLQGDRVKDIDACFTFSEKLSPITAVICKKLGLRGLHPGTTKAGWSKHDTYEALMSDTRTEKYSPISYLIQQANDVQKAKQITYPAILKPESMESSWGVVKVMSEDDCLLQYNRIQDHFTASSPNNTSGMPMVLMELLEGLSYEVDVVIYDGELMAGFVADIGLYLPNNFACTTVCTPSNLSEELQDQLITAAHHCCCNVGLLNGVFNTEFKITNTGLKLIEINGRVGSFRRCITYKTIYGVNFWEIAAAIACGIKPCFPEISSRYYAVGAFLFRKHHGKQFLEENVGSKLREMVKSKEILLVMQPGKLTLGLEEEEFPKPFCHLVALNKTSIKLAREAITQIFLDLGFTGPEYDIARFTSIWA